MPLDAIEVGFQSVHSSLFVEGIFLAHDPAWATAIPDGVNMFCGHIHELFKLVKNSKHKVLNVGVDVWDYTPVSFELAKELLEND
jgi:calcineurin-like phosphoesterase family protein